MDVNLKNIQSEDSLYDGIARIISNVRTKVATTVNTAMVRAYWHIGQLIVDKQGGAERSTYGNSLINSIAKKLSVEYGKGFSAQNLRNMRQFYLTFPNCQTLSSKLSWSHYQVIMRVSNAKARELSTIITWKLSSLLIIPL